MGNLATDVAARLHKLPAECKPFPQPFLKPSITDPNHDTASQGFYDLPDPTPKVHHLEKQPLVQRPHRSLNNLKH